MYLVFRTVPSIADIDQRQSCNSRKYTCNDFKRSCIQSKNPSYHKNVLKFADLDTFNTRLNSGSMDHFAVADV